MGGFVTEGFAMNRIIRSTPWDRARQKGTTLIVALVLVLLATLLALFAMNVGLLEQRSSANDVRSRLVQQTTEAALAQGVEYFRANPTQVDSTATNAGGALWELCGLNDQSFPCGTVEKQVTVSYTDSAGTAQTKTMYRRQNMYRFIGGGTYDVNGNGITTDVLDVRSVPLDRTMSTVGNGYTVNYGAGALLCLVKIPTNATDPTDCTTDTTKASGTNLLTLTAVGGIAGESATTTLNQAFGVPNLLNNPVGKPPVVASGTVDVTGGIQVVTNPNAAGPGVPISVWTRLAMTKTGTPNTCYMDDFIRDQTGSTTPGYEGTSPQIITCDTCKCSNSLSYESSGNASQMGIDILDVDAVPVAGTLACPTGGSGCKSNFNVKPNEFPCDMFQFVFGDQAWTDNDGDNFCETRIMVSWTGPDGTAYTIGEDEKYLYNNATQIIPTSANTLKVTAGQLATCSILSLPATTGLVWDQQGCGIGSNKQVGTPDFPVLLVEDGSTQIQGRMFGLLFVRAPGTPLDPTTGGSSDGSGGKLNMNAGSAIYGSAVIQGQFVKGNGTASIVYNAAVLGNLGKEPQFHPYSPVPASWSDRFAY